MPGQIGERMHLEQALEEATIVAAAGNDNVAVNGAIIDLQALPQQYESVSLEIHWKTTLASGKTLSVSGKMQHGAASNLSDAADYLAALPVTVVSTGAQTNKTGTTKLLFDLKGAKRYIRATVTADLSAGSVDTVLIGAKWVFGGPSEYPAT